MSRRSLTGALGPRLVPLLLLLVVGSCGKDGGDLAGPPPDDPGDPGGGGNPPPATVASVDLQPTVLNLTMGQTGQLTATARGGNGSALSGATITWASADAAIATVSGAGRVTPVALGDVEITATSGGKSATAAVTVSAQAVATLEVSPSPASVSVGKTAQLAAVPKAGDGSELLGRPVTWTSSSKSIATVDPAGLVTGLAAGTATITATSEGKSGSTLLTVSTVPVATVTVTPSPDTLAVGEELKLTATAKDANGKVLAGRAPTWTTSDPAIARVSATGRVSAIAPGPATITATIEGVAGTASILIRPVTGTTRTWKGGAAAKPTDWSTGANWTPAGKPGPLDTAKVAKVANPAVLGEDAQVAALVVNGGHLVVAGHRLLIKKAIPEIQALGRIQ